MVGRHPIPLGFRSRKFKRRSICTRRKTATKHRRRRRDGETEDCGLEIRKNGVLDEIRIRDLCRDSGLQVLSTTWKSTDTDGTRSRWKYVVDNVIVYRRVHREGFCRQ